MTETRWPTEVKIAGYTMPLFDKVQIEERIAKVEWYGLSAVAYLTRPVPAPESSLLEIIFGLHRKKIKSWENRVADIERQNKRSIQHIREQLIVQLLFVCKCPVDSIIVREIPKIDGYYVEIEAKAPVLIAENKNE